MACPSHTSFWAAPWTIQGPPLQAFHASYFLTDVIFSQLPYGRLFTPCICSDVSILPMSLTCPQSPLLDSFLPTFNFFSSFITVQHTVSLTCWSAAQALEEPLEARLYQARDLCLCLWLSLTAMTIPRMLQSLRKELILARRRFHWRHIVPISHTASHFSLPYDFQGYYSPCSYTAPVTFIHNPFFHFLGTQCLVPEHSLGVWEFWLSIPKTAQLEVLFMSFVDGEVPYSGCGLAICEGFWNVNMAKHFSLCY